MLAADACMACNPEPKPEEPLSLIESMCPFLTTEFIAPGKPYCEDAFEQSPADVTIGSSTGTSHNQEICSPYRCLITAIRHVLI